MKNTAHSFIVKILDDYVDPDGHQCIIQELYNQDDFSKLLKDRLGMLFSEQEIIRLLANIILIVQHLNANNIYLG